MRSNLKLAAAIGLFAFAGAVPAYAADAITAEEPPAPAPIAELPVASWAGPYAGINLGYGFSGSTEAPGVPADIDTDGFVGSAFGGYNWQMDNFVFGGEAELGYNNVKGSSGAIESKGGVEGSLRARLGYAVSPDILLYGTAGGAGKNVEVSDGVSSDSNTMLGWTAGAGADIKLTDNIFGRVEYRYTDFGHADFNNVGRVEASDNRVTFGVGMKF
jgi:outer membrane immunogenic protein